MISYVPQSLFPSSLLHRNPSLSSNMTILDLLCRSNIIKSGWVIPQPPHRPVVCFLFLLAQGSSTALSIRNCSMATCFLLDSSLFYLLQRKLAMSIQFTFTDVRMPLISSNNFWRSISTHLLSCNKSEVKKQEHCDNKSAQTQHIQDCQLKFLTGGGALFLSGNI